LKFQCSSFSKGSKVTKQCGSFPSHDNLEEVHLQHHSKMACKEVKLDMLFQRA